MNAKPLPLGLVMEIVFALILVSCQSQEADISSERNDLANRCSPGDVSNGRDIYIGATVPFSEPGAANEGLAMMTAFQIAANDINESG